LRMNLSKITNMRDHVEVDAVARMITATRNAVVHGAVPTSNIDLQPIVIATRAILDRIAASVYAELAGAKLAEAEKRLDLYAGKSDLNALNPLTPPEQNMSAATETPSLQQRYAGVADIAFLVDCTASMTPCIDALKSNIERFIDYLSRGNGQDAPPVRDWRAKIVGYRDAEFDERHGREWFIDNPFVREASVLKSQLASLRAAGGGDDPESLLDALYKIANMEETAAQEAHRPNAWRYRREAARVVVVFTDAPFHPRMSIREARNGDVKDLQNLLVSKRVLLSLFAPDLDCYDELSQVDKSEWMVIGQKGDNPQKALETFTREQSKFRDVLKQLAASISKSTTTEIL
jgi:hypothetical protein